MLSPPKNPTPMQTMNMKPDKIKIVDNNATKRKCDHPGVVGENDSCTGNKIKGNIINNRESLFNTSFQSFEYHKNA